jgi:hypothetical protein
MQGCLCLTSALAFSFAVVSNGTSSAWRTNTPPTAVSSALPTTFLCRSSPVCFPSALIYSHLAIYYTVLFSLVYCRVLIPPPPEHARDEPESDSEDDADSARSFGAVVRSRVARLFNVPSVRRHPTLPRPPLLARTGPDAHSLTTPDLLMGADGLPLDTGAAYVCRVAGASVSHGGAQGGG